MRWPVVFSLTLLLFHGFADAEAVSSCESLLAAHVTENRGFIDWSRLNMVLYRHFEPTLVLKVRDLKDVPDWRKIKGLENVTLRGGAPSADQRTRYFTVSGWSIRIYNARGILAEALGPGLQFQAVALNPRQNRIDVHRAGPLGRGAKALRKRFGNWWWARAVAGAMLFVDNAYVALRDDGAWPVNKPAYHRFLAMTDPNPALVHAAAPPPPPPTVVPPPVARPAEPPVLARGEDRLRPAGIDSLYAFLKSHADDADDLSRPDAVRFAFETLFARLTGRHNAKREAWLKKIFKNFDYERSLTSRPHRGPVLDAWAELFHLVNGRPRRAAFTHAGILRNIDAWPFPGAPPPRPRVRVLKIVDRLRDEDVIMLYAFLRERTRYAGDLATPGVVRDLFSSMFTKLQGWRDPARTEWLAGLFTDFDHEDSLRDVEGRRAVLTAWRKLFAEVHRRSARGPFDRRQLEADIAAWPYAARPVPAAPFDPSRVHIDEFDEFDITHLLENTPDTLVRVRETIARSFPVAPARGDGGGRTVRVDNRGGHTAIDLVVDEDPEHPGALTVRDVRRSKLPGDAHWSEVAAAAGLADEVLVIEGGTVEIDGVETDEVLLPAFVRARLQYGAGIPYATIVTRVTELRSGAEALVLSPAGPHQLKLDDLTP